MNPLFSDDGQDQQNHSYLLPDKRQQRFEPHHDHTANPAVELIRRKIDALYAKEPDAKTELAEAKVARPRSKHQEFMKRLSTSGRSLAEIQAAWHRYYQELPDHEKHEVWQEFYDANRTAQQLAPAEPAPQHAQHQSQVVVSHHEVEHQATESPRPNKLRSVAAIKKQLRRKVQQRSYSQIKAKQHLQSLAFGLGLGALVLLIFLFGLFNEVVIAPFIRPTGQAHATPIILSTDGVAPTATPEVIIPKINAELPVIYGSQSVKEEDIQNSLLNGVFHYPTTALPGQQGNAAYFGHSSNNIFNKGKYKFAFVLLHELEPGDIFYLTNNQKVYTYRVYDKRIVSPSDTWVLNPVPGKLATATLITCDPPGTSLHRLIVWGEQISPDPTGNNVAATPSQAITTVPLAGNGPSAWTRIWHLLTPW